MFLVYGAVGLVGLLGLPSCIFGAMAPIDEDAFWRTLIDCKASRYLTASEVQFLLKYRDAVEAAHAEHERRRAELDSLSRLLAAACSSAPPSEEMLSRLLDRQPQSDAADNVVKAFVAVVRLLINRSAVREGLAATRSTKHDRVQPTVPAAAAAAYLDYGHFKKVLRKLESKAYVDAIETDLKCCQKLVSTLQSSYGHGADSGSQQAEEPKEKPNPKHKRHSLPLPSKADGSPPAANDQVVQKLFPLQKLMHTHPACDRLNEDPVFKNGHLEEKIKYLLDVAHSRPAAAAMATASAVAAALSENQSATPTAPLRRTVATQCEPARPAERRDAAVYVAAGKGVKAKRRASEPAEARPFGGRGRDDDNDADDDDAGRMVKALADEVDGVQDIEDGEDIAPLRLGAGDRHMEALRSALAHTAAAAAAASSCGGGPAAKVPSAKTEREMLLYIAKEIQDEWAHVFRDLMDDAQVPLDDVQVLKAEIEENYKDAFLQACQCLERWRRAAGSFEVPRLRKVFESRHRRDLVNYMEARVTRASGAVRGRSLN